MSTALNPLPVVVALSFAFLPFRSIAAVVIEGNFNAPIDSEVWNAKGPSVMEGTLVLKTSDGDEGKYVGSQMECKSPNSKLNFTQNPLRILIGDLNLTGSAPADKRAFMVVIGSNNSSEVKADGYIRLCVNGDGTAFLTVPEKNTEGKLVDKQMVNFKIKFPVKKVSVHVDKQGCKMEVEGSNGVQAKEAAWGGLMPAQVWENASPFLTIKSVRRPAAGYAEAALGTFKIEAQ